MVGLFRTDRVIGTAVASGEHIALIGDEVVGAPLTGIIRGLTLDGAQVMRATKVVEVDPRDDPKFAFGIGERPRRIAQGVQSVLMEEGGVATFRRKPWDRETPKPVPRI